MAEPHYIEATFKNGMKAVYTTAVLNEPLGGIMVDPDIVEIVDLETGEILKERS